MPLPIAPAIERSTISVDDGASLRGNSPGVVAFGDQLARQRNQFAAIFDGVDQRLEAADREVADAEIVIVAEHFRDLLRRADQRVGVAVGAGELGDFGPQTFIDAGALFGQRKQPARAGGRTAVSRLAIALILELLFIKWNLVDLTQLGSNNFRY